MWCLGLAGGYLHDAAACLFEDGNLLFFVEEERYSRVRYSSGSGPRFAIQACLSEAGIRASDLDAIALSWNPYFPADRTRLSPSDPAVLELLPEEIFGRVNADVYIVDHQLAHAASAFRTCGESNALVISADGSGDGKSMA